MALGEALHVISLLESELLKGRDWVFMFVSPGGSEDRKAAGLLKLGCGYPRACAEVTRKRSS